MQNTVMIRFSARGANLLLVHVAYKGRALIGDGVLVRDGVLISF